MVPIDDVPAPTAEERLARYRATGDRRLRNEVVAEHRWLAEAIARRTRIPSEPLDDVVQVASFGLLKAAERFDPDFGVSFTTFAAVTARGEIRRYYRDAAWAVHVPRRLHDLRYEVRAATELLRDRLARAPRTEELAAYLHVAVDEVIDCLCAESNFRSVHYDAATGDRAESDRAYDAVEAEQAFGALAARLPDRLRRVVEMRFEEEMKQSDIAAVLGVSQVQVSRMLRQAVHRIKRILDQDHDALDTTEWRRTEGSSVGG